MTDTTRPDGLTPQIAALMTWNGAVEAARKAIYDDGRGMIGRANRNQLENRVARAIQRTAMAFSHAARAQAEPSAAKVEAKWRERVRWLVRQARDDLLTLEERVGIVACYPIDDGPSPALPNPSGDEIDRAEANADAWSEIAEARGARLGELLEAAKRGLNALKAAKAALLGWKGTTSPAREAAIVALEAAIQRAEASTPNAKADQEPVDLSGMDWKDAISTINSQPAGVTREEIVTILDDAIMVERCDEEGITAFAITGVEDAATAILALLTRSGGGEK